MANKVIGDYTAAASIDGSTHYLLIQPGSASTPYLKINRNVLLGVTGQPMDISTSQTVTNKTLGNTNVLTIRDDRFTLQDNIDTTKQAVFELSGITTATTRTYTLPNASSTLADISTAQTLTNKTLTSPVITNGSITGTTITTDSIVGQTSATSGTVYGMSIASGKVGTNGVVAASITDGSVVGSKLSTSAITLLSLSSSTSQTGITTSPVILTNLTGAVTIPAGGRRVRAEVMVPAMSSSSICTWTLYIYNSATVTGSAVATIRMLQAIAGTNISNYLFFEHTPAAGSQSYCAAISADTGTGQTVLTAIESARFTVKVV